MLLNRVVYIYMHIKHVCYDDLLSEIQYLNCKKLASWAISALLLN